MGNEQRNEEVRKSIETLIAYLEEDWGYCKDDKYSFGCPSCEAAILRRKLESISNFVGE